jgi:hypothetical protein
LSCSTTDCVSLKKRNKRKKEMEGRKGRREEGPPTFTQYVMSYTSCPLVLKAEE